MALPIQIFLSLSIRFSERFPPIFRYHRIAFITKNKTKIERPWFDSVGSILMAEGHKPSGHVLLPSCTKKIEHDFFNGYVPFGAKPNHFQIHSKLTKLLECFVVWGLRFVPPLKLHTSIIRIYFEPSRATWPGPWWVGWGSIRGGYGSKYPVCKESNNIVAGSLKKEIRWSLSMHFLKNWHPKCREFCPLWK